MTIDGTITDREKIINFNNIILKTIIKYYVDKYSKNHVYQ